MRGCPPGGVPDKETSYATPMSVGVRKQKAGQNKDGNERERERHTCAASLGVCACAFSRVATIDPVPGLILRLRRKKQD